MSDRYVRRAAFIAYNECGEASVTADQIIENDAVIDTGLLDENGEKIYRCSPRIKMGFCSDV